jgi:flagellar biosynthesis protein FliR
MELSLTELLTGPLVIGVRISGLMLFAPFFGNTAIPPRIKAILVILITAVLYPVYSAQVGIVTLTQWPGVIVRELVLGIAIGLATNFVFEAAQMAGAILGVQMGYSLVNILDPQTQVDTTVVALFHQSVAFLLFLQLDVHHWILRGIAHSFEYLAPGAIHLNHGLTTELLHGAAGVLATGLQIAAPVLAATLVADVILGFLGKASPQMPLMLLGPALKSMLGVGLLITVIHYWPALFQRYFTESVGLSERLLHLAARS